MKGFSREILKISEPMVFRLEEALTSEIVIRNATAQEKEKTLLDNIASPDLYADAETSHLPVAKVDF